MRIDNNTVVYVPWYVKNSLDANNISLGDFVSALKKYNDGDETVLNKISSDDIEDVALINNFMQRFLFTVVDENFDNVTMELMNIARRANDVDSDKVNNILNVLNVLSSNNTVDKKVFTLTYENKSTYVILNEGFSNFIKFNNKDDLKSFINSLIVFMFKYFDANSIYDSKYFKKFLILNK